jgi:hypothetical protein
MEARVIPFLHHYPVSTKPEQMWEHGDVMLGFDAEERLIQKLPQDFAAKASGARVPASRARNRRRSGAQGEPLVSTERTAGTDRSVARHAAGGGHEEILAKTVLLAAGCRGDIK